MTLAPAFDIARTMRTVLLALLPGVATAITLLGIGVAVNVLLAVLFALACEASALRLRRLSIAEHLRNGSAIVTALLIALALPPFAPWWIVLFANAAATLLGKHAYGGLGQNIFNPAMSGYALALLLFPAQLAHWPQPAFDGVTMATALDSLRQNHALTAAAWRQSHPQFGQWGAADFEWINLAFFGGGLFLLQRKIIGWHIPAALLAALGIAAAMYYDNGSSASAGSPLFHWLSGATMLGAFFIATDPATAASTIKGKLVYGASIGISIFAIRHWGAYPDGVAFAVLFANGASLLLDRLDGVDIARLYRRASTSDPHDVG
jgi:electron transport complex protein RnfD